MSLCVPLKGPGHLVRRTFEEGRCSANPYAVYQDATGNAKILLHCVKVRPCWFAWNNYKEETEEDLGEQASFVVVWLPLSKRRFEVWWSRLCSWIAYFEVLSLKWNIQADFDLTRGGFKKMRQSISNTAEYGDYVSGLMCNYWASQRKTWRLFLADIQMVNLVNDFVATTRLAVQTHCLPWTSSQPWNRK